MDGRRFLKASALQGGIRFVVIIPGVLIGSIITGPTDIAIIQFVLFNKYIDVKKTGKTD